VSHAIAAHALVAKRSMPPTSAERENCDDNGQEEKDPDDGLGGRAAPGPAAVYRDHRGARPTAAGRQAAAPRMCSPTDARFEGGTQRSARLRKTGRRPGAADSLRISRERSPAAGLPVKPR